jgi:hypothetical protein
MNAVAVGYAWATLLHWVLPDVKWPTRMAIDEQGESIVGEPGRLIKCWSAIQGDRQRVIYQAQGCYGDLLSGINRRLLRPVPLSEIVHGSPGRSIMTAAQCHLGDRHFVCIDMASAFETGQALLGVQEVVRHHGLKGCYLEWLIAQVVSPPVLTGSYIHRIFPRGFCTSPALFNLACSRLDRRLTRWCENRGWCLTRYVDNITISSSQPFDRLDDTLRLLDRLVRRSGWQLNHAKTRVQSMTSHNAVELLGLTLSERGVSLSHRRQRELTDRAHWLMRQIDHQTDPVQIGRHCRQLAGTVSYLRMVMGEQLPPRVQRTLEAAAWYI